MPVNNNSVYHRMRMLNQGEKLVLPFSDYNKVRTTECVFRKDFGIDITHRLVGEKGDPDRKIVVFRPTVEEEKLSYAERKKEARYRMHKNMIEYNITSAYSLFPDRSDQLSAWVRNLINKHDDKEETKDSNKV